MVRATSLDAYKDGEGSGSFDNIEDRIDNFMLCRGGIWTRRELAKELDILTSTLSGRVTNMLKEGRLTEVGKVECAESGRKVRGLVRRRRL